MIDTPLKEAEIKMQKSLDTFMREITAIRTGRATPSLVDSVTVEYYGTPTPLKHLASISAPEPRLLVIQPWDRSQLGAIEKALQKSDLGLNPGNDGTIIRVPIPPLNEERRREYVRLVKRQAEECRVAIRNVRRDQLDHLRALEKDGKATVDDVKRGQERLQKTTDRFINQTEAAAARKEAEIMEV
jgi:ribosome recycling factor